MYGGIPAIFGRLAELMVLFLSAVLLPLMGLLPLAIPAFFCVALLLLTCCGRFAFTAVKLRVQKLE